MKFARVPEDGPAGKAALKSGDVLIEYGGQKIDNPDDLYRLRYAHYEGEKVMVTVMRGHEKIIREVTLRQMRKRQTVIRGREFKTRQASEGGYERYSSTTATRGRMSPPRRFAK